MKRISLWGMSTLTVLVLLFGYHTSTSSRAAAAPDSSAVAPISGGSPNPTGGTTSPTGTTSSTGTTAPPAVTDGSTTTQPSPTTGASSSSPAGAAVSPAKVTGSVTSTRWGPVQVQLTVADGRITDVSVVQYPHENSKDQRINARAL